MTGREWSWDMPMNRNAPWPWGIVLGGLAALAYALLAFLGWYSFNDWLGDPGRPYAPVGVAAAFGVGLVATVCMVAKALGWWMVEWVALWFLMSALSVHAFLELFGSGWPAWAFAEAYFLVVCASRNVSLMLFARQARWGADRRHLRDTWKREEA